MPPRTLNELITRYLALADKPPRSRTDDERASLDYLAEELAQIADPRRPARGRVGRWVADVRAVEAFAAAQGHLPRARNGRTPTPPSERHLEAFLRVSRRPATRELMCGWQEERLALIPGYDPSPRDDAWDRRLVEYVQFVERFGRQPVKRTESREERRLAIWAVTQRATHRRGEMAPHRARALERIPGWLWTPPGRTRR